MSEFPEWLERRLPPTGISHKDADDLHRAILILDRYVPDLDARLTLPMPLTLEEFRRWPWWRRYIYYVDHS